MQTQVVPAQKKTLTSSLLFQVMNTDSSVDKGSQGPPKRRPRGVRYNLKLTDHFLFGVWQDVRHPSRTVYLQQDQQWFMTNEPYCEMHACLRSPLQCTPYICVVKGLTLYTMHLCHQGVTCTPYICVIKGLPVHHTCVSLRG